MLLDMRADPSLVAFHSVIGTGPGCGTTPGTRYFDVTTTTAGETWEICLADYGAEMLNLATVISPLLDVLYLWDEADPATLVITATEPGGAVVVLAATDYAYDAVAGTITFTGYLPPVGTAVVVEYRAVP